MAKTHPAEDQKHGEKQSLKLHSAHLSILDKNGDGKVELKEQPWQERPSGIKWIVLLYSFSWLSKFQKSPVVGSAEDQSAAIKETVNTIGLIAALVITITVPIAMNPGDVDFKTNTDLWGSDIQVMDEAATKVCFYASIYLSIAFHVASITGAILSVVSVSCLSGQLLIQYIDEVGTTLVLFPLLTFLVGTVIFVVACAVVGSLSFGVPITAIVLGLFLIIFFGLTLPLIHILVKHLYKAPNDKLEEIKDSHQEMARVTKKHVGEWLGELLRRDGLKDLNIDKKKIVEIFEQEGISGMALPSINEEFLLEKCKLSWGDAYLLMREIELRKGHVTEWLEKETDAQKSATTCSPTNTK